MLSILELEFGDKLPKVEGGTCNFDGYVQCSWLVHFWGPYSDHDKYKIWP